MANKTIDGTANIEAVRFKESAAPGTPASGYAKIYVKSDGLLYMKDDAGTETLLTGSGFTEGCRVYNSGNISINDQTVTSLTFDSERFDTDTMHSTSSNTDRVTFTTAGKYVVSFSVRFATNATGTREYSIWLNNTTPLAVTNHNANAGGGQDFCAITTIYNFSASDYVTFRVWQSSGGALNVEAASNYGIEASAHRIG